MLKQHSLPITVVIPVKNEEKQIVDCLQALEAFSDVVVVDSGSSDRTQIIAETYGAKVLNFRWDGKFPKKRNWVLSHYQFTTPWVLFLDADEIVTDTFCREIANRIQEEDFNGYWLIYNNYFMGKQLRFGDKMRKLALLRLGKGEYERIDEDHWSSLDMEVHEHLIVQGKIGHVTAPIDHYDFKGLDVYYNRHNQYSSWEAARYQILRRSGDWRQLTVRQRLKYRFLRSLLFPPLYFLASYLLRLGFLDRRAGLMFGLSKMFYFYQIAFKVRESEAQDTAS